MGHADGIRNNCQDRYFNGACHWGYYENGGYPNYGKSTAYRYSLQDGEFHLFTLYWNNEKVSMYVDQDKYPDVAPYYEMLINDKSSNVSPGNYFHHDFFLLFNLAVGGNFPQLYNKEEISALQQSEAKMYVNFVKVYQKGEDGDFIIYPKSEETSLKQITSTERPIENNFIYDINGRLLESNYKNSSNNILIIKRDNSSEKIILKK
jgi:beta-glucanase (GH16 family)